MMAKISSGQGFAGLVDYANDIKDKNANIIASEGVDLTSNKSIVASFSLQAKSRPSLKNFVGHISLSFAPEDAPKLSDTLMADIAKEYLRRMGIVNTQFVMSVITTSRIPTCISPTTGWATTATPSRATKVSASRHASPKPSRGNTVLLSARARRR